MDEIYENAHDELAGEILHVINRFVETAREEKIDEEDIKAAVEFAIEFVSVHWEDF